MVRRVGLHDDAPRDITAASPASRLGQELEGPFPSPVGRNIEQAVGR